MPGNPNQPPAQKPGKPEHAAAKQAQQDAEEELLAAMRIAWQKDADVCRAREKTRKARKV